MKSVNLQVTHVQRKWAIPIVVSAMVMLTMAATPETASSDEKQAVAAKYSAQYKLSPEQLERIISSRGLSDVTIGQIPQQRIPRLVKRVEMGDLPRLRAQFRLLTEQDENKAIAPLARYRAIQQVRQLRNSIEPNKKVSGLPSGPTVNPQRMNLPLAAGVNPTSWVSLGPGNIGGRIRSLVIHPTTPNVMWAASVAGGVWRTDSAGAEWRPVSDLMANMAVSTLVMDPTNATVLYAGTGEGFGNVDGLRGAGVFQSTDSGATWKQLSATANPNFRYVNRLSFSKDGKILLAATRSDDIGQGGIYRSALADHSDWNRKLTADIADVDFHPTDSQKAVASGMQNGKAYFTTDGGDTWNEATIIGGAWSGRVEVTYAIKNPEVVYASVNVNNGEIWRSEDGGKTYKQRNTGKEYLGGQGWYDNVIWAGDPTDENLVIVGGVDLWKSENGGTDLVDISTWWAGNQASAHADHHAIVSHPSFNGTSNKSVYFCNDGGVYVTEDVRTVGNNSPLPRTHGWKELNNQLGITMCYGGAGHAGSGTVIIGAQDNGTLRFTPAGGSEKYTEMFGGDGGFCAADPSDQHVFYGEYVNANLHRSLDGGASAEFISGQFWNGADWVFKPFPFCIPDARDGKALFIAPFILDPNEPNRLLVGGTSLWKTNDAKTPNTTTSGPKWASAKAPASGMISAIAVAKGNSNIIWVGHESGEVYRTENGTAAIPNWTRVDTSGTPPLPKRYITRITIDPANHKQAYVTLGGFKKDNVWRTTNNGAQWSAISTGLPEAPVRSLVIHHTKANWLYIGTEVGIFASEDGGSTWSPSNEGPTNCSVDELFWLGTNLYAATHGRGLFRISVP